MKKLFGVFLSLCLIPALLPAQSATPEKDHATYIKHHKDPVLEEMKKARKEMDKKAEEKTEAIKKEWKDKRKKEKDERTDLKADYATVQRPASPDSFKQVWHSPPVPQFYTGTCWAFSTTSFYESEIHRLTGKSVKLSEMFTVYWEYVEKVKGYIASRGNTELGEGSEGNAVPKIWKIYGIVPRSAFPGVLTKDGRYDHVHLMEKINNYMDFCDKHNTWNESEVISVIKTYLNEEMGVPPAKFSYEGKEYTPKSFLKDYLKVVPDDYVDVMSTMKYPFYTQDEFKVPDNWWHDKSYYNVPLDVFYDRIKWAITHGYSIAIGGDVSEVGYYGFKDAAYIPSFDIPYDYINQDARELRIVNHTTGDDHGLHLVGFTHYKGHDWFLIKDSARSSRWGDFRGYYMYRDDYVKLKMLTIQVHKDVIAPLMPKFEAAKKAAARKAAEEAKKAKKEAKKKAKK